MTNQPAETPFCKCLQCGARSQLQFVLLVGNYKDKKKLVKAVVKAIEAGDDWMIFQCPACGAQGYVPEQFDHATASN